MYLQTWKLIHVLTVDLNTASKLRPSSRVKKPVGDHVAHLAARDAKIRLEHQSSVASSENEPDIRRESDGKVQIMR